LVYPLRDYHNSIFFIWQEELLIIAKIDILSSSAEERDRAALPVARTDLGRGGYNAWQVDAAVAKVALVRMEIVGRSDGQEGLRRPAAAPLSGRAHLLLNDDGGQQT